MRLLVTRPEPDASAMAGELRDLGHEPVLQPLLEFSRLDFDTGPLKWASALIFTSGNALRALKEVPDLPKIACLPIFCAGNETARRARQTGFHSVAAIADTAEGLASVIAARAEKTGKLVHVTGEHQAFGLAGVLRQEGFSVCTLRAYEMAVRAAFEPGVAGELRDGMIGGVILMSPRTAGVFVSLCQRHQLLDCAKALRYFCLAESVARMLEPLKPAAVDVAAKPNRMALLALLGGGFPAAHDVKTSVNGKS